MKIKLLIGRAGFGFAQNVGEIVEVGADEALRMIEAGQAEPLTADVRKETATKKTAATKAVKD